MTQNNRHDGEGGLPTPSTPVEIAPATQDVPGALTDIAYQQVQVWQGQFPPPEAIERYEAVMPGAFDRLMRMAEAQQQATIAGAAEARRFFRNDNQRGHYLGFAVTIASIAGAVTCVDFAQPAIAALLVGVPVLSVAKALVDSVRNRATRPAADRGRDASHRAINDQADGTGD